MVSLKQRSVRQSERPGLSSVVATGGQNGIQGISQRNAREDTPVIDSPTVEQNQLHEGILFVVIVVITILPNITNRFGGRCLSLSSLGLGQVRPQGVGILSGTKGQIQNGPSKDLSLATDQNVGRKGHHWQHHIVVAIDGSIEIAASLALDWNRRRQRPEGRGNL